MIRSLQSENMSLQPAFRVAPQEVDACAKTLEERGVAIVSPPTDQPFGHRTLFFREPDGNVLEIYAEIVPFANNQTLAEAMTGDAGDPDNQ
jgi:hypothetical protein